MEMAKEKIDHFTVKILYRYEGYEHPYLTEYKVIRYTPKGYWIDLYNMDGQYSEWSPEPKMKFICCTAIKCYAYPTKELAKESYIARKKRQIAILSGQIERARDGLTFMGVLKPKRTMSELFSTNNIFKDLER
jgi:hypothetical protein